MKLFLELGGPFALCPDHESPLIGACVRAPAYVMIIATMACKSTTPYASLPPSDTLSPSTTYLLGTIWELVEVTVPKSRVKLCGDPNYNLHHNMETSTVASSEESTYDAD